MPPGDGGDDGGDVGGDDADGGDGGEDGGEDAWQSCCCPWQGQNLPVGRKDHHQYSGGEIRQQGIQTRKIEKGNSIGAF